MLQPKPKVSEHPQKELLPTSPFSFATEMSIFLSVVFRVFKTTLDRGNGGKGSSCLVFLSDIESTFRIPWFSSYSKSGNKFGDQAVRFVGIIAFNQCRLLTMLISQRMPFLKTRYLP